MKNKARLFQIISVLVILFASTILLTWQITYNSVSKNMNKKYTEMIDELTSSNDISRTLYSVDTIIKGIYPGEINEKRLADYTISGYINGLGDRYAYYMDSEQYSHYLTENKNTDSIGIGVSTIFDLDAGGLYVISVYKNTPAANAGILPGEIITKIDGKIVTEIGSALALEALNSGESGSSVSVTVKADSGSERLIILTRSKININTITYKTLTRDIGIIKISDFNSSTSDEFKNAVQSLIRRGVEKFVIDVRNNPGTDLDAMIEILDFILPSGNILTVVDKNGTQKAEISNATEFSAPMVVLVNGKTTFAAELFAAGLRDYNKAVSVGEKTYGKASSQSIIEFSNGGAANISLNTYLPPCGVSFEGTGIVPQHEVILPKTLADNYYKITDYEDSQLQKAIELLNEMQADSYQ